jgi:hypothetical protein
MLTKLTKAIESTGDGKARYGMAIGDRMIFVNGEKIIRNMEINAIDGKMVYLDGYGFTHGRISEMRLNGSVLWQKGKNKSAE